MSKSYSFRQMFKMCYKTYSEILFLLKSLLILRSCFIGSKIFLLLACKATANIRFSDYNNLI